MSMSKGSDSGDEGSFITRSFNTQHDDGCVMTDYVMLLLGTSHSMATDDFMELPSPGHSTSGELMSEEHQRMLDEFGPGSITHIHECC